MIPALKSYPTYKPSGVEWLGDVPEHWQMVPNRALMRLKKELVGSKSDEYLLLSLTKRGVVARDMENPEGKFPAQFDSYQVIEPGDLIFCLFDIDETPRTVGLSSLHGMITGAYTRVVCADETARRFVYLLYMALDNGKHLKPLYTGLRKVITKSTFLSAKMPLPSPPEQAAIVRYLDHVDRRIRRYIRAKQKLIKLLEEQKQALIHQIVTRGLDPNVRLKPSGVEWLGDVPEHWEIHQLGRVGRFFKGVGGTKEDEVPSGVPCVRYGDLYMQHQYFIRESRSRVSEQRAVDYTPIQYGDVLFAGSGETIEEIGKSAVNLISRHACCGGDVIIFRSQIEVDASFLGYATDCPQAAHQKSLMGRGVTVMHIYGDELKYVWVAIPPLHEQAASARYLDKTTADVDTAIDRARRQIELLREYRPRLIADVVTGKLDVREAAASLLEEADERDPLDEVVLLADDVVDNLYHRVGRGAGNGK